MYPGKEGSTLNHRKGYCSDGARQKSQQVEKVMNGQTIKIVDHPPPYPQPSGIFTDGKNFFPMRLIHEVSSLYERVVVRKETLGMQDLALASMLHQRTLMLPVSEVNPRPLALFKLFPSLTTGDCPAHLLVKYEDVDYLSLDELVDVQAHLGGQQAGTSSMGDDQG